MSSCQQQRVHQIMLSWRLNKQTIKNFFPPILPTVFLKNVCYFLWNVCCAESGQGGLRKRATLTSRLFVLPAGQFYLAGNALLKLATAKNTNPMVCMFVAHIDTLKQINELLALLTFCRCMFDLLLCVCEGSLRRPGLAHGVKQCLYGAQSLRVGLSVQLRHLLSERKTVDHYNFFENSKFIGNIFRDRNLIQLL